MHMHFAQACPPMSCIPLVYSADSGHVHGFSPEGLATCVFNHCGYIRNLYPSDINHYVNRVL